METEKDIFDRFKKAKRPELDSNYFASLSDRVLAQKEEKQPVKGKQISLFRKGFYALSAVAALAVLFFGIRSFYGTSIADEALTIEKLSDQEILAYVEQHIDDVDLVLLLPDVIEKEGVEVAPDEIPLDLKPVEQNSTMNSVTKEEIMNYLQNQELDLDDIEEVYL